MNIDEGTMNRPIMTLCFDVHSVRLMSKFVKKQYISYKARDHHHLDLLSFKVATLGHYEILHASFTLSEGCGRWAREPTPRPLAYGQP